MARFKKFEIKACFLVEDPISGLCQFFIAKKAISALNKANIAFSFFMIL